MPNSLISYKTILNKKIQKYCTQQQQRKTTKLYKMLECDHFGSQVFGTYSKNICTTERFFLRVGLFKYFTYFGVKKII